jgi:hypothetical protein
MTYADIETKSFGPGEEGSDGTPSGMARAWYAHMAGLKATYHRLTAANPALIDQRIQILLDPQASAHKDNDTNWAIPNEIEILLARLLPPGEIDSELDSAFATADRISVPSRDALRKRAAAAMLPDEKQAVLATLLRDTHNRFAQRRSERVARKIVADRMTKLGFGLTGLIVVVFCALGSGIFTQTVGNNQLELLVKYNLLVTTFFGFLGAYLSRLIAFQTNGALLGFDDLENGYSWHFLMVRLLVGGMSAVILHFVISGNLIGGELFPSGETSDGGGFGKLWQTYDSDGMAYSGPSANYAKLIVWCFIAGFSERFLPDHLSALEAKSKA